MAWTTALRREIADEFAELIPTQWTLLLNGWMFKRPSYWSDDGGEMLNVKRPSRGWQFQSIRTRQEVDREGNRFYAKVRRSSRRRVAVKRLYRCAGCGSELDHSSHQNVRKYCTPECQKLKLRKDRAKIKKEEELRQCHNCYELFLVERHKLKKTCSPECQRARHKKKCREYHRNRR